MFFVLFLRCLLSCPVLSCLVRQTELNSLYLFVLSCLVLSGRSLTRCRYEEGMFEEEQQMALAPAGAKQVPSYPFKRNSIPVSVMRQPGPQLPARRRRVGGHRRQKGRGAVGNNLTRASPPPFLLFLPYSCKTRNATGRRFSFYASHPHAAAASHGRAQGSTGQTADGTQTPRSGNHHPRRHTNASQRQPPPQRRDCSSTF